MSDTPRTDEAEKHSYYRNHVASFFARQLERELNAYKGCKFGLDPKIAANPNVTGAAPHVPSDRAEPRPEGEAGLDR